MKELEFCYPLVKLYSVQREIRESVPNQICEPPLPPMINPRAIRQVAWPHQECDAIIIDEDERRRPPEVRKPNRQQQRRAAQGRRGPG
eukprot:2956695-Rhodomonas_salina.2